tara:strand:- start:1235 stop:2350 length:1116 start_codon:yes stop_codon:yes gene_type:complete
MLDSLLPEGFRDEVSKQAAIEHKYLNLIIKLFTSYGYELVKAPLVEFTNQFNSKNTLNIKVKKNKKELSIRDDITMQIARLANARLSKKKRPLKLCYYGEVVRVKGSILRPERQFLQIGAECIGEKSYLADVEMIELAYKALTLVGIKKISIELSSRIFLDKFYEYIKSSKNNANIRSLIRKKDINKVLKLIDTKNQKYIKNIFSCIGIFTDKIKNLKKLNVDKSTSIEIKNLINIHKYFVDKRFDVNFFLDLSEINDKNYHNSTRFTIFAEDVRGEIAKGGRYISYNQNINENSTGFTCYMDTILRASSKIEKLKKILVPFDISEKKRSELIKKKYIIERYFGTPNKIKNMALLKKYNLYLLNNKILKLK